MKQSAHIDLLLNFMTCLFSVCMNNHCLFGIFSAFTSLVKIQIPIVTGCALS